MRWKPLEGAEHRSDIYLTLILKGLRRDLGHQLGYGSHQPVPGAGGKAGIPGLLGTALSLLRLSSEPFSSQRRAGQRAGVAGPSRESGASLCCGTCHPSVLLHTQGLCQASPGCAGRAQHHPAPSVGFWPSGSTGRVEPAWAAGTPAAAPGQPALPSLGSAPPMGSGAGGRARRPRWLHWRDSPPLPLKVAERDSQPLNVALRRPGLLRPHSPGQRSCR